MQQLYQRKIGYPSKMCHSRTKILDPRKIGYPRKKFSPAQDYSRKNVSKKYPRPTQIYPQPKEFEFWGKKFKLYDYQSYIIWEPISSWF